MAQASQRESGATVFAYRVADPQRYGVVGFTAGPTGERRVSSLEEKPSRPASSYAVTGLYFYDEQAVPLARQVRPSPRGELEITDLNRTYLESGNLRVQKLGRGTAWLDTGTHDSLLEAAEFVRTIQHRQGLRIACLEEIGLEMGFLNEEQFAQSAERLGKSTYGAYLRSVLERRKREKASK
jgi:glucose-1-phosphate thymidylyltransferase